MQSGGQSMLLDLTENEMFSLPFGSVQPGEQLRYRGSVLLPSRGSVVEGCVSLPDSCQDVLMKILEITSHCGRLF